MTAVLDQTNPRSVCNCPCHRGAGHHHRGYQQGADPCPSCGVTDPAAYLPTYCMRCGFQTGDRKTLCGKRSSAKVRKCIRKLGGPVRYYPPGQGG